MPSPFPGMNPYLEQEDAWHDFHGRFIPLAAEVLGSQIGDDYIVKIEEHVYIHELPEESRRLVGRTDVSVTRMPGVMEAGGSTATIEAPSKVWFPQVDVEGQSFLEIRTRRSRQLVAVLELLSPSNKSSDRDQYIAKRNQLLVSRAHFVELDLLRGGRRLPLDPIPSCDYYALVSRVEARPRADLWPIHLRDELPTIPVPLNAPDADLPLNLQDLLHRIYDAAKYRRYIYESNPNPPLAADDAAWAQQFLPTPHPTT